MTLKNLINLESRQWTDVSAVSGLRKLESIGKKNSTKNLPFLLLRTEGDRFMIPLSEIQLPFFNKKKKKQHRNIKHQVNKIKVLQNNVSLFGQLFIAMQSRDSDLDTFFPRNPIISTIHLELRKTSSYE